MTIALKQGSVFTEIGPGDLLHSLFSTVAVHLENGVWGARFPTILGELYQGSLPASDADAALVEMREMKRELSALPPDKVVWDIDNLSADPPWGRQVGAHVTSVAGYYVTTSQRNLVDEIIDNLESLQEFGGTLDIVSYRRIPK